MNKNLVRLSSLLAVNSDTQQPKEASGKSSSGLKSPPLRRSHLTSAQSPRPSSNGLSSPTPSNHALMAPSATQGNNTPATKAEPNSSPRTSKSKWTAIGKKALGSSQNSQKNSLSKHSRHARSRRSGHGHGHGQGQGQGPESKMVSQLLDAVAVGNQGPLPLETTPFVQLVPQIESPLGEAEEESRNYYLDILDSTDRRIYLMEETSSCGGGSRPFNMCIYDDEEAVAFRLQRSGSFNLCWFGARTYGNEVMIETPTGHVLGYVKQHFSFGSLSFEMQNGDGDVIGSIRIQGPKGCIWFTHCIGPTPEFAVVFNDLQSQPVESNQTLPTTTSTALAQAQGQAPDNKEKEFHEHESDLKDETTIIYLKRVEVMYQRNVMSILKKPQRVRKGPRASLMPGEKKSRVSFLDEKMGLEEPISDIDLSLSEKNKKFNPRPSTTKLSNTSSPRKAKKKSRRCWRWVPSFTARKKVMASIKHPTEGFAFIVQFPEGASADRRAIILAAALMIDLTLFDERKKTFCNCYGSGCFCLVCICAFLLVEIFFGLLYSYAFT